MRTSPLILEGGHLDLSSLIEGARRARPVATSQTELAGLRRGVGPRRLEDRAPYGDITAVSALAHAASFCPGDRSSW